MVSSSRLPPNALRDFGRLNFLQGYQRDPTVSGNFGKDLDNTNPALDFDNDILVLARHDMFGFLQWRKASKQDTRERNLKHDKCSPRKG